MCNNHNFFQKFRGTIGIFKVLRHKAQNANLFRDPKIILGDLATHSLRSPALEQTKLTQDFLAKSSLLLMRSIGSSKTSFIGFLGFFVNKIMEKCCSAVVLDTGTDSHTNP